MNVNLPKSRYWRRDINEICLGFREIIVLFWWLTGGVCITVRSRRSTQDVSENYQYYG